MKENFDTRAGLKPAFARSYTACYFNATGVIIVARQNVIPLFSRAPLVTRDYTRASKTLTSQTINSIIMRERVRIFQLFYSQLSHKTFFLIMQFVHIY